MTHTSSCFYIELSFS